jgi:Zn-dependent alcohol dehydrogenase
MDLDDLCDALSATKIQFDDIIDSVQPFGEAEEAIEKVWQGKVVGKLVLQL